MRNTYRSERDLALQDFLKLQFSNLEEAKDWIAKWANKDGQVLKSGPEKDEMFSVRAMSGHISLALDPQQGEEINSSFSTRYGDILYQHWQESLRSYQY